MHHIEHLEASPQFVIVAASLAAACMVFGHPALFAVGALGALILAALALRSPWLGVLAVFPLAFSIRPAPPGIGMQEAVFALLVAIVFLKSIADAAVAAGWRALVRQFGKALALASILAVINLLVAVSHGVGLADWLRGLIPFLFILLFIPVVLAIDRYPERIRWLGLSIGALITLLAGHIVIFYLANELHHPYWWVVKDGMPQRITEELAVLHADANGPFLDRITMQIQSATDALLPVGVVAGFVVAALARDYRVAGLGFALAALALGAVLMTYTRSMLLSAVLVLAIFVSCVAFSRKSLSRAVRLLLGLGIVGAGVIAVLNIESMWGYRIGRLSEALMADGAGSSVTSRLEEYRIAWGRFVEYPLLGDGLGAKHSIEFMGPEGVVEQQVAYIHNWPLYFLMATGGMGFLAYAWVMLAPAFIRPRSIRHEGMEFTVLRAAILTMAIYGLFFAVFRLITFNLLLAAAWGVVLAGNRLPRHPSLPT
jgi:hypothetical protein